MQLEKENVGQRRGRLAIGSGNTELNEQIYFLKVKSAFYYRQRISRSA